ncbi:MAG: metallophosphoesterase [Gemmatimonadota bacterium]
MLVRGLLALLLFTPLAGCYPVPADPVGIAAPPPPFQRIPWVQDVDRNSAVILWMTAEGTPSDVAGHVEFRVQGEDGDWVSVSAVQRTDRIRSAALTGLPSGAGIEYQVPIDNVRQPISRFRTAPDTGAPSWPVRVLLFGDSGWGGKEQIRLARQMRETTWDLLVHLGDVAYEDGTEEELTTRHFRIYDDILQSTPMFPAVGNHDLHTEDGAAYDAAFVWRSPYEGERYYAYRWGGVQFIVLDTSSPTADVVTLRDGTGRQYDWLRETLQVAHDDPSIEWTIVYMHHPLFSHGLGISGHGGDRKLRVALAPLFEQWGVDLVAAGHEHHYERTTPIRAGRKVPRGCGPIYVVAGGGGASRYARGVGASSVTAISSREYAYVDLSIEAGVIMGRAIKQDGSLLDEFSIRPYEGMDAPACSN